MSDIEKLKKNHEDFERKVRAIRQDEMLSEKAKVLELEQAYTKASTTYDEFADAYRAEVRERLRDARKRAFAAPTSPGDVGKAFATLSYRDALDRVSRLRDTRELSDLLARAEITGDHFLARAVLYRGYELQSEGLVGSYLEKYPAERKSWDEFMAAATEHNHLETYGPAMALGVPSPEKPRELERGVAKGAYTQVGGPDAA